MNTTVFLNGHPATLTPAVIDDRLVLTTQVVNGRTTRVEMNFPDALTLADQITIAIHRAGAGA